jgi:hypothetical protein
MPGNYWVVLGRILSNVQIYTGRRHFFEIIRWSWVVSSCPSFRYIGDTFSYIWCSKACQVAARTRAVATLSISCRGLFRYIYRLSQGGNKSPELVWCFYP